MSWFVSPCCGLERRETGLSFAALACPRPLWRVREARGSVTRNHCTVNRRPILHDPRNPEDEPNSTRNWDQRAERSLE